MRHSGWARQKWAFASLKRSGVAGYIGVVRQSAVSRPLKSRVCAGSRFDGSCLMLRIHSKEFTRDASCN